MWGVLLSTQRAVHERCSRVYSIYWRRQQQALFFVVIIIPHYTYMRVTTSPAIGTTVFTGLLLLAFLMPHASRASEDEEFSQIAVQLNAIQSVINLLGEREGTVLGASTNRIAELRAKIWGFTAQINELAEKRSETEKELNALLNNGSGGGSGGGGTVPLRPGTGDIRPACALTSDRKEYKLGDTARFTWQTNNATSVFFVPDTSGKDNLVPPSGAQKMSGSVEIPITVLGSPFITISAVISGKSVNCKATITVTQPDKGGKKAEYKGYFSTSNTPFIISKKETKAVAVANCAQNSNSNPTKKVWCTWDGVVIMGTKPEPNTPNPPPPPTPPTPATETILESVQVSHALIANNQNDQSDNQGRFDIKFDVTAHDSDMYIARTSQRGMSGSAGALVTIEDAQGVVVVTGTMSGTLSSTADVEGNTFRVNEGETKTFTVAITFDPVTSGAYRAQLQGINWNTGGNGGTTFTATTPVVNFETGVLII